MRAIEYRGKDIETGEWRYGYIEFNYDQSKCRIINPLRLDLYDFPSQVFEVDPETVGQFTGILDKNGKKIYEGDILMYIGKRIDNEGKKYYRKVIFKDGCFSMEIKEYKISNPIYNNKIGGKLEWEITENIYDNPELMKGGEQ